MEARLLKVSENSFSSNCYSYNKINHNFVNKILFNLFIDLDF